MTQSSHTPAVPSPTPARSTPFSDRALRYLRTHWLALVLAVAVIFFIAQNRERVSIDLFSLHLRSPLWLVLTGTAAVGVIIGMLMARRRARRKAGQR